MSWNKNLLQFFTWWNGSTWGTRFFLWRAAKQVGEDALGNIYYLDRHGKRHVQYAGVAEASSIPAAWHSWMHYRTDVLPEDENYIARDWQKAHKPNQTGTANAYYPKGSLSNPQERETVAADYEAWRP